MTPIHKEIVERAFKNGDVVVDIGFHSEYDNLQVLSGKKDPKKDPTNFRFESYVASIDESRTTGKKTNIKWNIDTTRNLMMTEPLSDEVLRY